MLVERIVERGSRRAICSPSAAAAAASWDTQEEPSRKKMSSSWGEWLSTATYSVAERVQESSTFAQLKEGAAALAEAAAEPPHSES